MASSTTYICRQFIGHCNFLVLIPSWNPLVLHFRYCSTKGLRPERSLYIYHPIRSIISYPLMMIRFDLIRFDSIQCERKFYFYITGVVGLQCSSSSSSSNLFYFKFIEFIAIAISRSFRFLSQPFEDFCWTNSRGLLRTMST